MSRSIIGTGHNAVEEGLVHWSIYRSCLHPRLLSTLVLIETADTKPSATGCKNCYLPGRSDLICNQAESVRSRSSGKSSMDSIWDPKGMYWTGIWKSTVYVAKPGHICVQTSNHTATTWHYNNGYCLRPRIHNNAKGKLLTVRAQVPAHHRSEFCHL